MTGIVAPVAHVSAAIASMRHRVLTSAVPRILPRCEVADWEMGECLHRKPLAILTSPNRTTKRSSKATPD